jgi:hypothetical protein
MTLVDTRELPTGTLVQDQYGQHRIYVWLGKIVRRGRGQGTGYYGRAEREGVESWVNINRLKRAGG